MYTANADHKFFFLHVYFYILIFACLDIQETLKFTVVNLKFEQRGSVMPQK